MAKKAATFESINPATGEVVGVFPICSKSDVDDAVARAHSAKQRWSDLGFRGRYLALRDWASLLTREIDLAANLIHRETGKPLSDATLEVALAIEHISWAGKFAPRILSRQNRPSGLLMFNLSAQVQRVPYGVVGVIGPWNYPIFTPIGSIAYALAAGNTVVFKPSEFTPAIGAWLGETWKRVAPFDGIFSTVTGTPETGVALTSSNVDKISFTGSTRTAKKVAAACADRMIPVVLECGGKDPVLIDRDADIEKAAEMTLWHAMSNAGQSCIGAERVYVHEKVAERFTEEVLEIVRKLEPGKSYGPATMPKQLEVIKRHIEAAQNAGAKMLYGDENSVNERIVNPVVMADVPEDCSAMTEETFGPTLAINRVANMDEAIKLSNASEYGLGAAVFSKHNGYTIADKLDCGAITINTTFTFMAVPSLPFGGVKDSGYGRIHGPEGLFEFTYARSIVKTRFEIPIRPTSFKRTEFQERVITILSKYFS